MFYVLPNEYEVFFANALPETVNLRQDIEAKAAFSHYNVISLCFFTLSAPPWHIYCRIKHVSEYWYETLFLSSSSTYLSDYFPEIHTLCTCLNHCFHELKSVSYTPNIYLSTLSNDFNIHTIIWIHLTCVLHYKQ